jgi:hypothetical protein
LAGFSRFWKKGVYAIPLLLGILFMVPLLAGCGQGNAEATVMKFLGGVQAHDFQTMRSCVDPQAVSAVEDGQNGLTRQWEQLDRRYTLEPIDWRLEFEGIRLESDYKESGGALVRIAGGSCKLYDLREDRWVAAGKIDFATADFTPIYLMKRGGDWYIEALDIYIVNALEKQARN